MRDYPVDKASSAPATGRLFYEYLMENLMIPATSSHYIWKNGIDEQLKHPDKYASRGDIPVGKTLELLTLQGQALESNKNASKTEGPGFAYTFDGTEQYVLVSDLAPSAMQELCIPANVKPREKVFNSNYKEYDDLPKMTKLSNELAALSVAKSVSSYLAGVQKNVNYSEKNVVDFLKGSLSDMSSPEMAYILHGNHLAWSALDYMRSNESAKINKLRGDIVTEFYGQNAMDFYMKDVGTIIPTIYFGLAVLGENPILIDQKLDVDIWGSKEVAAFMMQYMSQNLRSLRVA